MEILHNNYWFNPNISPTNAYIPICSQCSLDFEDFKKNSMQENMETVFKHPNNCIWYDFFIKKVKIICPSAKIVRKKNKKLSRIL